jgi:hypothetical protein
LLVGTREVNWDIAGEGVGLGVIDVETDGVILMEDWREDVGGWTESMTRGLDWEPGGADGSRDKDEEVWSQYWFGFGWMVFGWCLG